MLSNPGYKVFPAAHSFMHASSSIFWCSSEPGKPVEPAYPSEKRQRESKKSKVVKFHPILCMPAPSFDRSQREIQVKKALYKKPEEISKCLETNEKKKGKRLITNFWVAKPKKQATPRCFYETRVIESKSKKKSSMCKGKGNKLFRKQARVPRNPTQTPDWFSLQSSCHPVSKDK
jgi:hypothetical protein